MRCPNCGQDLERPNPFCPVHGQQNGDRLKGTYINRRYQLGEVIGSGGTGTIYQATDVLLNRTVAVKVLAPHLVSEERFINRLEIEIRVTSTLKHPNIMTLLDYGVSSEKGYFLVLEYLEGETLQERLTRETRLDLLPAIAILKQVCHALDNTHSHKIIHRDIKPGNIFLMDSGGSATHVKLFDFGIAKLLRDSLSCDLLTRPGELFGTPWNMSPEQVCGYPIDHRADIYGCGVLLYEMLVGHPPFTSPVVLELFEQHKHKKPTPPRKLRRDIPKSLNNLVLKALAKKPEDRFASAQQMAQALEQVQSQL